MILRLFFHSLSYPVYAYCFGFLLFCSAQLEAKADENGAIGNEAEQQKSKAKKAKSTPTLKDFSLAKHQLFQSFLEASLEGEGKARFEEMARKNRNKIFWTGKGKKNRYIDAFERSYPLLTEFDTRDVPEIVLLIPYQESLWQAKNGNPASDYGYWQLIRDVVDEIKTLPYVPEAIKNANTDTIRSDPHLSTQTALIHLRRYYFYFHKVAEFSVSDACFFTMVSFNWGAGNVKRMLYKMQSEQIMPSFSNFYSYLYDSYKKNPQDKSMKAALDYLPKLWNIAQVIQR